MRRIYIHSMLVAILFGTILYSYAFVNTEASPTKLAKQHGILPPLVQVSQGVEPAKVKCKEGLQLVFKLSTGMPACVKPSSVPRLVEIGWARQELELAINKVNLAATEEDEVYMWKNQDGTNPDIVLVAKAENEIDIQNPTDAKHELVIESNGEEIASSGDLEKGQLGKITITPDAEGVWQYHCEYHPLTMKGTIKIIGAH